MPPNIDATPSMSSAGAAIRQYNLSRGGAVMSMDTLDEQIESKFGPQSTKAAGANGSVTVLDGGKKVAPNTPKVSVPVPPVEAPAEAAPPFQLETEVVETQQVSVRRGKRKAETKVEEKSSAKPTVLVEYQAKLEGGASLFIPEYAHVAKVDGETMTLGFPISNKARLKPERGSTLDIKVGGQTHACYATGIYTDIPEWGVSLSIFLIEQK